MINRRHTLAGLLAIAALPVTSLHAQTGGALAFPYYSGEDALQGLYAQHLPPLARDSTTTITSLSATISRLRCGNRHPSGAVPGGHSDRIRPCAATQFQMSVFWRG